MDPARHKRVAVVAAIGLGLVLLVIWPLWRIFGPAIEHSIENPVTTVESRDDIENLPSHVDRLSAPSLSDSDLEYLSSRVSVRELDLGDNPNITDEGLRHVARIQGIEHLSLIRTGISDKGIRHLRKLPLIYIALWHTQTGDEGLGYIAEMAPMKQLQLKDCQRVTDKGVLKLKKLNHLWMVNLSGCNRITDRSVEALSDMPSVNFIQVFDCPNVSDDAVDQFLGAQQGRTLHR
jgi:hypothetical protein